MARYQVAYDSQLPAAIADFENLSKAQQRAVIEASKLGPEYDRLKNKAAGLGRSGKRAFGDMAAGAFKMAASFVGLNSAASIFGKFIEKARDQFAQLRDMAKEAAGAQLTYGEALGGLIANNPLLATPAGKKELDLLTKFANEKGVDLGKDGPARVLKALTDLRSATPGASVEQQNGALARAIKQYKIDPNTDLAQFATAVVKIQQGLGVNEGQAANILTTFGSRAGGDIAGLAGQVAGLKGAEASSGVKIDDLLALFGFSTAALGDPTGEKSSTAVRNLVARTQTRNIKIGGKRITLEGENGLEKVLNFLDRVQAGEFGTDANAQQKALAEFAKQTSKGVEGQSLLGELLKDRKTFDETRRLVRAAGAPGTDLQQQQLDTKLNYMPSTRSDQKTTTGAGQRNLSEVVDPAGEFDRVETRLDDLERRFGLTNVADFARAPRRGKARYLDNTPASVFEREERRRVIKRVADKLYGDKYGSIIDDTEANDALHRAMKEANVAAPADIFGRIYDTQGEEAALRQMAAFGLISPEGGLSRTEAAVAQSVGIDDTTLIKLGQLYNDANEEAYKKAFDEFATRVEKALENKQPVQQEPDR